MKKLSKILALSLALAMVLGMTAFAAGSIDTQAKSATEGVTVEKASLSTVQETKLNDAKKAKAPAGVDTNAVPKQLDAFELVKGASFTGNKVAVSSPAFANVDFTKYIYVALHWVDDGKGGGDWQVHNIEKGANANELVILGVTTFSPFIIVEYPMAPKAIEPVGEGETPATTNDDTTTPATTTPATTTPVSPKTGETMPVAAMIALLVLVCAAVVGTKKVIAER